MAGARGEGTIEYQGQSLPVLLTNRAIADVEKATGKSMIELAQTGEISSIGVNDVAQLLRSGLEYGRRDANIRRQAYTLDETFQIMDAIGFVECTRIVIKALADVLTYQPDPDNPPAMARSEIQSNT